MAGAEPGRRALLRQRPDGVHAKLALALAPNVKGCEWQDGFKFTDFVRTRAYDSKGIKPFVLPGVLRYFDVDEL